MAPLLLIRARTRPESGGLSALARLAVAGTFVGHGLYAAGIHPVPGPFIDMVILHFGVTESSARHMLLLFGLLDFAVGAAMLLPHRLARFFLLYAAIWGGLTALARIGWHFDAGRPGLGWDIWISEVLMRAPHAGIPLWLLLRKPETRAA
jgi:hypothetical protein